MEGLHHDSPAARINRLRIGFGATDAFMADILHVSLEDMGHFVCGTHKPGVATMARLARLENVRARLPVALAGHVGPHKATIIDGDGMTVVDYLKDTRKNPLEAVEAIVDAFEAFSN